MRGFFNPDLREGVEEREKNRKGILKRKNHTYICTYNTIANIDGCDTITKFI
jgi:hypothetical protein